MCLHGLCVGLQTPLNDLPSSTHSGPTPCCLSPRHSVSPTRGGGTPSPPVIVHTRGCLSGPLPPSPSVRKDIPPVYSLLAASQTPLKPPPSGFLPTCDFVSRVEWDKLVIQTIPRTLRAVTGQQRSFRGRGAGVSDWKELRLQDEATRMEHLEDLCTLAAECSRKPPNHLQ